MFDISFWELTVIFVITLLVVGPDKLPGLVRDVGRVVRKLRRVVTQTRYELEREFTFEEERRRLTESKAGLDDAMDELDDLMKIAPDRDTPATQDPKAQSDTTEARGEDSHETASQEAADETRGEEQGPAPESTQKSDT